jgi:two-component system CheB/CheR fusion protein
VVDKIRKMVIFAHHDLLKDSPFNNLGLVTCRNLLIYLTNDIQQKILSMFGFALRKSGFLFLGSSEAVGNLSDLFSAFDSKWRVYRYKGGANFTDFGFFDNERVGKHSRVPVAAAPRPVSVREPDTLIQRIQRHLLDEYVPPTIVLDQDFNLVHTLGDVNDFLQLPRGQASFNIFRLTDKHLAGLISNAIRKAQKTQILAVSAGTDAAGLVNWVGVDAELATVKGGKERVPFRGGAEQLEEKGQGEQGN